MLKRKITAEVREQCNEQVVSRSGGSITGLGPALKATQEYPQGYAEAIVTEHLREMHRPADEAVESSDSDYSDRPNSDGWSDADLADVEEFMGMQHKRMPPGF